MITVAYKTKLVAAVDHVSDANTASDQGSPSIARLADDSVVVTYNHFGKQMLGMTLFEPGTAPGLAAPILDTAPANSTSWKEQFGSQVTALKDGGFAMAFNDLSSGHNQVRIRLFDGDGKPQAADKLLVPNDTIVRELGGIAQLKSGDIAVSFQSDKPNDTDVGIAFLNSKGIFEKGVLLESGSTVKGFSPSLATLSGGGSVVAWSEEIGNEGSDLYVRRLNASNNLQGSKILVDTSGSINDQAQVLGLADGGFVVAYRDNGWATGTEISLRIYNADGTPRTYAFRANEKTEGTQAFPKLTLLDNGFFAVSWETGVNEGGSGLDVKCRIFDPSGAAVTGQFSIADSRDGDGGITIGTHADPTDPTGPTYREPPVRSIDAVGLKGGLLGHVYGSNDTSLDGSGATVSGTVHAIVRVSTGGDGADTINGDGWYDEIHGGGGKDTIKGGGGNDEIEGGAGADTLDGGSGFDTLIYANSSQGVKIDLAAGTGRGGEAQGDVLALGTFEVVVGSGKHDVLLGDSKENTLIGGGGDDTIDGRGGNDILQGGDGDDELIAGIGKDVFDGGNGRDIVRYDDEGSAIVLSLETNANSGGAAGDTMVAGTIERISGSIFDDTIEGSNSTDDDLYGNGGADTLRGLNGNDTLGGGSGLDKMYGGTGDDLYLVYDAGDQVFEQAGEGHDTVSATCSYVLAEGQQIEELKLARFAAINGTGNSFDNWLTGNTAANTLDGGGGADRMEGGLGDDTYIVDNAGDVVVEKAGEGLDEVHSSVSFKLAGMDVETLLLTGSANIDGTGNALDNTIKGNGGKNVLDGGAGIDTMAGGAGDDTYVVSDTGDKVVEDNNGGTDLVQSSVSFSLAGTYAEKLTLTGSADIDGKGNALVNTMAGNAGDNVLDGGAGSDSLLGGLGEDTFAFSSNLAAGEVDTISDFSIADDTIRLDNDVFTALQAGGLAASAFKDLALGAVDADDRILYNAATGALFYDQDGSGNAHAAVQFATLSNHAALTALDFIVI